MDSYSNPRSMDSGGEMCEGSPCVLGCECDNQFTFCLRPQGGSRSDDDMDCILGSSQTSNAFPNSDFMSFAEVTDLGNSVLNPVVYTGNSWPVSYHYEI